MSEQLCSCDVTASWSELVEETQQDSYACEIAKTSHFIVGKMAAVRAVYDIRPVFDWLRDESGIEIENSWSR